MSNYDGTHDVDLILYSIATVVVIDCAKHSCFHKRIITQCLFLWCATYDIDHVDCSIRHVSASDRHGWPTCDDSVK